MQWPRPSSLSLSPMLAKLVLRLAPVECVQTQQLYWGGRSRVGGAVGTNPHHRHHHHHHHHHHNHHYHSHDLAWEVLSVQTNATSYDQPHIFSFNWFKTRFGKIKMSTTDQVTKCLNCQCPTHNYAPALISRKFPEHSENTHTGWQQFLAVAKEAYRGRSGSARSGQNITNDHFYTDPAKAACVNIILAPGRTNPHKWRAN